MGRPALNEWCFFSICSTYFYTMIPVVQGQLVCISLGCFQEQTQLTLGSTKSHFGPAFTSKPWLVRYTTPLKINMEPKNHLILKRTIIFHSPPFWGFQPLIFQGPKGMIFPSNMWRFDLRFTATLSQRHGWFAPLLTALSDATGSSSGTLLFLGIEHVLFFICYLGKDIDIHRGSQALLLHRNLT